MSTIGIILIIIVVVVVVLVCCYYCAKAFEEDEDSGTGFTSGPTTPCYLCLARVGDEAWNSGTHRKLCAQKNVTFLSTLPMPYPITCPRCQKRLRLWPDRGPEVGKGR